MRGHWEYDLMTIKAILKHYYKIIMTFVTTIETFKHDWLKSSKLKKVLLLKSWDLSLKGEKILTTLEIFKNLRQRKRTVYFGLETLVTYLRNYGLSCQNKWSNLIPKSNLKQVRDNGFVKYIYKTSDIYKSSIKCLTWQGIQN